MERTQNNAIFVISASGERLMPTVRHGRVRHLLKDGKAKIVKHNPFTIQLLYEATSYVQPIEFCEDTGDHHVGVSLKSERREFVSEEYRPLADEKDQHDDCRKNRRNRRSRLRHRPVRFDNRKNRKGKLPPSVEHKTEVNLHPYAKYLSVCPITRAIFEVGRFDTQRMQAIIDGKELPEGKDYQQGPRYNLETLRTAVFMRDKYTCVFCERTIKDGAKFHAHHALYWMGRHGDQLNEMVTCCEKCHTQRNHQKGHKLWGYKPELPNNINFVDMAGAATMNQMRWRIVNGAKALDDRVDVVITYGSETTAKRKFLGIEKSHVNDAYVMGEFHPAARAKTITWQKVRRNNRVLEKFYDAKYIDGRTGEKASGKELFNGRTRRNKKKNTENLHPYRSKKVSKGQRRIRKQRYPIKPGDIVLYNGKKYLSKGCQSKGAQAIIINGSKKQVVRTKKLEVIRHCGAYSVVL